MQEYWVNVYENKWIAYDYHHKTRDSAIYTAFNQHILNNLKCIYRIHVKMKPKFRFNEVSYNYASKDIFRRDNWMD